MVHTTTVSASKQRVRDYPNSGFVERWEGRRTTIGDFSVHTVVSGPTFTTKEEAIEWANTTRTKGEDMELYVSSVVQPTPKKRKRKAK